MNNISNEQYELALKENLGILKKATKSFMGIIPEDELDDIKYMTLLTSMQKYNATKGNKFSTYLYQNLLFRCKDWLWLNSKYSYNQHVVNRRKLKEKYLKTLKKKANSNAFIENLDNKISVEQMLEILSDKERKMIKDKYFLSKSFAEIAREENVTSFAISLRISKILEKLKLRFTQN